MSNYKFEDLLGKVLVKVVVNADKTEILFITSSGETYKLYHDQDCSENVWVEDVCGDLDDLLGSPLSMANECYSDAEEHLGDSVTWTFYNMATLKGSVSIRWCGSSNGYYSESVDFTRVVE